MKNAPIARLSLCLGLPLVFAAYAAAQEYAPTMLEYLQKDGRFTTFLHLAKVTGTDSYLKNYPVTGCTVLAPTNDAFARVPTAVMTALGKNHEQLARVIEYHIVLRDDSASEIRMGPKTVEGEALSLTCGMPPRTAQILSQDIEADNGKLQIVDQVLFPPQVFKEFQRNGVVDIVTGLPIHGHMTAAGLVTNVANTKNSYAAARNKRKKARWNRIHTIG